MTPSDKLELDCSTEVVNTRVGGGCQTAQIFLNHPCHLQGPQFSAHMFWRALNHQRGDQDNGALDF